MKNKYDSSVVFLYSIGKEYLLPEYFRKQIPYSTIADWRKTDYSEYLGHEFRYFFDQALSNAELKFKYYHLKKTMMSLARSWVTLSHVLVPIVKSAEGNKQSQGSILYAVNYMRTHWV
jgi:hypothetical protein